MGKKLKFDLVSKILFIKVIGAIFAIFISGCAFSPVTDVTKFPKSSAKKSNCDVVTAKIAFSIVDFEMDKLPIADLTDDQKRFRREDDYAKIILSHLEENHVIQYTKSHAGSDYLIMGFTLKQVDYKWGLAWLPALSLGIIPIKTDGEYSMSLRIFSSSGTFIREYNSSKLQYERYVGWLLLPFAPWSKATWSDKGTLVKFVPLMVDELIDQMKNDRIVCKE